MSDVGQTWSGTHRFGARRLLEARSVSEVQDLLRSRPGAVRALGTRHSFNEIADTEGTLVSVVGIPPEPRLTPRRDAVSVGGGIRYGELAAWLEQRGLALHNMGSLPHISVAGAMSTGTHGSGDRLAMLADAVTAIEFVDATGSLQRVESDDWRFGGFVVGLGAYGVVTRIELAVQPSYRVSQRLYVGLDWDVLAARFDDVTASGTSVSVFTHWGAPAVEHVLVKQRTDSTFDTSVLETMREADPSERFDGASWTPQDGSEGPWMLRMPHFRLEETPSFGEEIQSEYFVPRTHAPAAIAAVRGLAAEIDPHLIVTELRTIAADGSWLGPASGRDTVGIHFTWKQHEDAVRALLPRIEDALASYDVRPHWGKWNAFDAARISAAYPRLSLARTLYQELDPDGVFSNSYLERLGVRDEGVRCFHADVQPVPTVSRLSPSSIQRRASEA
ncbi:FAD-binding protein [Agromyces sp. SYSU T0242]|uniref:FAD-binding protein n=1 Tax=Agromyces litoreus TaxID=3158561 RepID=UPI003391B1E2